MDIKGINALSYYALGVLEEEVSSLRGGNWLNILVLLHCTVTPIFDRKCLQAQFRCMFFLSITIGLSKMRQLIDKT